MLSKRCLVRESKGESPKWTHLFPEGSHLASKTKSVKQIQMFRYESHRQLTWCLIFGKNDKENFQQNGLDIRVKCISKLLVEDAMAVILVAYKLHMWRDISRRHIRNVFNYENKHTRVFSSAIKMVKDANEIRKVLFSFCMSLSNCKK